MSFGSWRNEYLCKSLKTISQTNVSLWVVTCKLFFRITSLFVGVSGDGLRREEHCFSKPFNWMS